jgi:hypothetical protein
MSLLNNTPRNETTNSTITPQSPAAFTTSEQNEGRIEDSASGIQHPESRNEHHGSGITVLVSDPPEIATCSLQPATNCSIVAAPVSSSEAAAIINTKPLPPPAKLRKAQRNGHVARLPKLQRDMVNHMLWNAVPYRNIVIALRESGFTVSDRNISNWATGGYLEWRLEQEHLLQCRLDQDHLIDFVRRDDAHELPEAGLQAAATRLSQVLLQKLSAGDDPEAQIDNYSKLVDLLCRLNREISASQKHRDDSRRTLGPEYDPVRVRDHEQLDAIENERIHSNPSSDTRLQKPPEPPLLPAIPTATILAEEAAIARHEAEMERLKRQAEYMKALTGKLLNDSDRQSASTTQKAVK